MFINEIYSNIRYRKCCNVEYSVLTNIGVIFTQIPVVSHVSAAT